MHRNDRDRLKSGNLNQELTPKLKGPTDNDHTETNSQTKGSVESEKRPNELSSQSSSSIFDNLENLKVSTDALIGSTEIIKHIPARKPKRQEYVRIHPDPDRTRSRWHPLRPSRSARECFSFLYLSVLRSRNDASLLLVD